MLLDWTPSLMIYDTGPILLNDFFRWGLVVVMVCITYRQNPQPIESIEQVGWGI